MRKLIAAAVLAVGLLGAPEAKANQEITVKYLLNDCEANGLLCLGFVTGVSGVMTQLGFRQKVPQFVMCLPAGQFFSAAQARQIFINWAKANPKHWQITAVMGVMAAYNDTYPC